MKQNTDNIPFARPSLGKEEEDAVLEVLRSGWLTTGEVALNFEKQFRAFVGARHAIAVNSATAGLHLSLDALRIPRGSLVITTPYTFTATAEILRYIDAHPLFVDIEEDTYNIDPAIVEEELSRRNRGEISCILPVHIAGLACDMNRLSALAKTYGIPIVEDCAHAFPLRIEDRYAGTIGTTGVFSFYANKTITTGEGGMVVTEDDAIADRIRIMRSHGIDRMSWDRYTSVKSGWAYSVVEAGYKYNLTDIAAAIGIEQLKKASDLKERRKAIAMRYDAGLGDQDYLTLPAHTEDHAWHLYMIRIDESRLSIDRDEFIRKLGEAGIGTSVHYIPLHIMPFYKKLCGYEADRFPIAMKNYGRSISLPIYPDLTAEQTERVISSIKNIGAHFYRKVRCTVG
jgi:dTDP-4-amino-4,6-dideoxygalactose transaminase